MGEVDEALNTLHFTTAECARVQDKLTCQVPLHSEGRGKVPAGSPYSEHVMSLREGLEKQSDTLWALT